MHLPNSIDDISQTLEREIILRRFNRDVLGMGNASGSIVNQLIGVRQKVDPKSGVTDLVTTFYPSYEHGVIEAFEEHPITQRFGISIAEAMEMPVDRWYKIRKAAARMTSSKVPESDNQVNQLIALVKELALSRRPEGDSVI